MFIFSLKSATFKRFHRVAKLFDPRAELATGGPDTVRFT